MMYGCLLGMNYILYIFQRRNWWGAMGTIAPPSRRSLPFLKEHENENIIFDFALP